MLETLWNRAYCRWFDHRRAGRRRRAALWGVTADVLLAFAGPSGPAAARPL